MSDARTDFFSAGSGKPRDTRQARSDFFSGRAVKSFDVDEDGKLVPSDEADYSPTVLSSIGKSSQDTAEAGAKFLTGIPASVAGQVAGLSAAGYDIAANAVLHPFSGATPGEYADPTKVQEAVSNFFTYQPDDAESAQSWAADYPGRVIQGAGQQLTDLTGTKDIPYLGTILEHAPEAAMYGMGGYAARLEAAAPRASPMAEAPSAPIKPPEPEVRVPTEHKSAGAAGAAVDLQKLSPDMQKAVAKKVNETGGAVNPDVLARHVQSDSLPVPLDLTEGQASGNVNLLSDEFNMRGRHPELAERFNSQNEKLVRNLDAFRDEAGPEVFSTNHVEHADTLIGRYKAIDEVKNAEISANYQALRDAAGGEFPVDTQALLTNVRAALKKDLATSKAPADVMAALEEKAAAGTMTLEDFEGLRTSLARTQRSAADGQERHAAGVIRDQIEAMPLQAGAKNLKGLADKARASARERFQALEADPAYKAAVNDSMAPDAFVQKFVVGGTRDNVAKLHEAMKGDETAMQTLEVATVDHLRKAAGIDPAGNGNFSQAGYNKALNNLQPKINYLLPKELQEQAGTLGDVARYVKMQPAGAYFNNSGTLVAGLKSYAKNVAEDLGNTVVPGIRIGTKVREKVAETQEKARVRKALEPGAGLGRLSDLTKLKEPK